jgi:hypothetical protein
MQGAVGAEAETILAQRDVPGIIAIEILAEHFIGALADAAAQGVADIDAFSRDPESHFDASIGLVADTRAFSVSIESKRGSRFLI